MRKLKLYVHRKIKKVSRPVIGFKLKAIINMILYFQLTVECFLLLCIYVTVNIYYS